MRASIAIVLPRYGASLGGGAETLVRSLALKLFAEEGPRYVDDLEVWTTCAVDHRTWDNALPAGATVEDGLTVRRFTVEPRNVDVFLRHEIAMREGRPLTVEEQLEWLGAGVNSRGLYEHIARHGSRFDALIFAPYLFSTTFWGALIHPDRSLLVPCLHDEHYAYQQVFQHLFRRVRGLICNTEPERELIVHLYGEELRERSAVVGMGFDSVPEVFFSSASEDDGRAHPYLLYAGRKEQGKNLDLLLEYYEQYRVRAGDSVPRLLIVGSGEIGFRESLPEGVTDVGFVSEREKEQLMREALALVQPSTNESFSIVMMEAWLRGTPVIVHGHCAVTRDHVVQSGGGLYFTSPEEFAAVVQELVGRPELAEVLGDNGRRYVRGHYSWEAVLRRLLGALADFGVIHDRSEHAEGERAGDQLYD